MQIRLGHSPDPDDAFMFWGLASGAVDTRGFEFEPVSEDIQTLNEWSLESRLEVIRHHRLLELYLAETLGVDVKDVHAEADKLEHVLSEELEARIDRALGFPTHDPHGDPIPNADLEWPAGASR